MFLTTQARGNSRTEAAPAPTPHTGTGFQGLGDTAAVDTSGIDTSFLGGSFVGGSVLTAFVLGVGIIIAVKTALAPSRSSPTDKKWAAGAWRSLDYEDPGAPLFTDKELKKLLRKNRPDPAKSRRRASRFSRAS